MNEPQSDKKAESSIKVSKTRDSVVVIGSNVQGDILNHAKKVQPSGETPDMAALATELVQLRDELKKQAQSAADYKSMSDVATAAEAAANADEPTTLNALKAAGGWALGIAQAIGLPLAIEALKRALSLK